MKEAIEIEAAIDEHGNVIALETIKLESPRRASITIFKDEPFQPYIEVHFTHPYSAQTLTAELSTFCTGQRVIQGLIAGDEQGPFLNPPSEGRSYDLAIQRTQKPILHNMTLAQAGVVDGDVIEVRRNAQGAGDFWETIQVTFAYGISTGAGLGFIKAIAPIIRQLVENKSKQVIRIKIADQEYEIIGSNPAKAMKSIRELLKAAKEFQQATLNQQPNENRPRSPKKAITEKNPKKYLKESAGKKRAATSESNRSGDKNSLVKKKSSMKTKA